MAGNVVGRDLEVGVLVDEEEDVVTSAGGDTPVFNCIVCGGLQMKSKLSYNSDVERFARIYIHICAFNRSVNYFFLQGNA